MKKENIILEVLVNGGILFFLFSAFVNIDLLKMHQIAILSIIVINAYVLNKKILRKNTCKISLKQILVALGIGIFNFIFLFIVSKIF